MTLPPPGWYPDPASADNIRYWDGQSWTDRVQPKTMPPPPVGGPAPVGPQQAASPQPQGYSVYGPVAPAATARTPQKLGPDGQVLAGWWRRAGGYIVDRFIETIPVLVAAFITASVIGASGGFLVDEQALNDLISQFEAGGTPDPDDLLAAIGPGFWTVLVVSSVVWLIISVINGIVLVARSGQTIGDRVVGVRKVMAGRRVPTAGVATGRWMIPNVLFQLIGSIVPFGFAVSLADYLWPLWDERNQTLHDKLVGTYVERADLAGPPVRGG